MTGAYSPQARGRAAERQNGGYGKAGRDRRKMVFSCSSTPCLWCLLQRGERVSDLIFVVRTN